MFLLGMGVGALMGLLIAGLLGAAAMGERR